MKNPSMKNIYKMVYEIVGRGSPYDAAGALIMISISGTERSFDSRLLDKEIPHDWHTKSLDIQDIERYISSLKHELKNANNMANKVIAELEEAIRVECSK